MHPTMPSEYFFVSNSINKFVKVTTRDKQLLKFNKICSILMHLSSVYVNPNFLYKKKDTFTWLQIAAIVWFLSLTLIILKPALESTNSDLQSQLRKCFTKIFFW